MRAIHLILAVATIAAAEALPSAPQAQVLVSVTVAPPPLPVYVQPVIPGDPDKKRQQLTPEFTQT